MEWIGKELKKSKYRVNNISNVLRVALLWRFGGTYLDTDMMVLRPFPKVSDIPNIIIAERFNSTNKKFSKYGAKIFIFQRMCVSKDIFCIPQLIV